MDVYKLTLTDDQFQSISELVHRKAGIHLAGGKKELVRARLVKRIISGQFADFGEYYRFVLQDESGEELVNLLDAISTNLTSFFRESKHFDFTAHKFLPDISREKSKKGDRSLRIWSAGCSTGEEPYSIAMTVLDHSDYFTAADLKILGTDLSTKALQVAAIGAYPAERLQDVPMATIKKYFQKGLDRWVGWYRVKEFLRQTVVFKRLNLVETFHFSQPFDLIFFRNVMIYFDKDTQAQVVAAIYQCLAKGGYLFIGHSESLSTTNKDFKYVEPTIYRK